MPEPPSPQELERLVQTLRESQDPGELVASATRLASSEDRDSIIALGQMLRDAVFMQRLDPGGENATFSNLIAVFRALAEHPTENTSLLCEELYVESAFVAVPARINLLLGALAGFRPMREEAAAVFRQTSAEGFAEVNGPLLLDNESPAALRVFEEIIAGDSLAPYVRVDILHRALLPKRTRLPVLQMSARLLDSHLPDEVWTGLAETLFAYRSREWFGPAMYPPTPPAWTSATTSALDFLIALAERLLTRVLSPLLRIDVNATRAELKAIVRSRSQ